MAATDLVYNTVDPVLFTPDYSFLRYNLEKAQSRYDQGLDNVSRGYNNLKKDLTDPVNKQRRDEYLKTAQSQLQKIAGSDLSLPQNIAAANSIFDPLATDPAFLFDSYHTDRIRKQLSIMDDWANSTDPEVRKQYNPEIQKWVARDLDVLRNGKGDINNYKNMGNRSAFAYVDAQDILFKAAKDYGYTFKQDSSGQPYIVTTEGGPSGAPSYRAFANTVLGSNSVYQRQLQILGQSQQEEIRDLYKNNPAYAGKTDDEIYQLAGLASYDKHRQSSEDYIKDSNKNYNKEDAFIKAFVNNNKDALNKGKADIASGNNNTAEAQMYNQLAERVDNNNSLKTTIATQQAEFAQTFGDGTPTDKFREEYAKNFAKSPQTFFADQILNNDIQRFVDIKSSSISRAIKEDSAYVAALNNRTTTLRDLYNMKDKAEDNARADEALALKEQAEAFKEALKGKKTTITSSDGTTTTKTEAPEVSVQSASSYNLYTVNALRQLSDRIDIAKSNASQSMTGINGALNILNSWGLDNQTVGLIKTGMTKQINSDDPSKAILIDKQEQKALSDVFHKIQAYGNNIGVKIDDGEASNFTFRTLPEYLKKIVGGFKCNNQDDIAAKSALSDYFSANNTIDQTLSEFNKGKQAVIAAKKSDPSFTGMFINRGTTDKPNWDIINEKDIIKEIKEKLSRYQAYDNNTGKAIPGRTLADNYSQEDYNKIAKDYINGKFDASKDGISNSMFNISPDKFKELTKIINNSVPIANWTDAQGMMLANPRYVLSGGMAEPIRKDLMASTQSNADIWEYENGTAEATEVDASKHSDIRTAIADKDNIAAITIYPRTNIGEGGLAVSVTFKNKHTDDSKAKQDWEGKEYFFPISLNQTTPDVLRAFGTAQYAGDYAYNRDKGIDYNINEFEADGIKAIMHPNKAGDTQGWIEILYKPWNQNTKSYGDWAPLDPTSKRPTYDENLLSIPETINLIRTQKLQPYVNDVIRRNVEMQNNQQTQQTGFSVPSRAIDNLLK